MSSAGAEARAAAQPSAAADPRAASESLAAGEPSALATRRELGGVALVLVAALLAGLVSLAAPLRRDFGGYQGAFFSIAAVNYERTGVLRFGGYPYLLLDGPALGGKDDLVAARDAKGAALVYRNHPPVSFWLGWTGAKLLGPRDWATAWSRGESPGIEQAVQMPFLLMHVLGLGLLWWWLRAALSARGAFIALCLAASAPVALHYGSLANLENPCLPFVFLALGAHVRWRAKGSTRWFVLACAGVAASSAVTWAPLAFAGLLALFECVRRRFAASVLLFASALLPLALHVAWSAHVVPAGATVLARPASLLRPLFEGSISPSAWIGAQFAHSSACLGWPLLVLAVIGAAMLVFAGRGREERMPALLATGGCALYLVAFYPHTFEEQFQFQLWCAPAAAILAAALLQPLSNRLAFAATIALCAAGGFGAWTLDRELQRSSIPQPHVAGPEIAALVPRAALAVHDAGLGLNLAYSYYAWRKLAPTVEADRWHDLLRETNGARMRLEFDPTSRAWLTRQE